MKAALTAVLFLMLPALAAAEQQRSQLRVAALVRPHIALSAVGEPAGLNVSEQDLQRGYVDAQARYIVSTNDRDGFRVRFAPRVGLAAKILISGLGGRIVVVDLEVDVLQAANTEVLDLAFRFKLEPGLAAGTYPWPVSVTATVD